MEKLDVTSSLLPNYGDRELIRFDSAVDSYVYHVASNSLLSFRRPEGNLLARLVGFLEDSDSLHGVSLAALDRIDALNQEALSRPHIDTVSLPISQIAISPTLQCNLNCSYCYNYQENEQSVVRKMPRLEREGVRRIFDTLSQLSLDQQINLAFIGGEPLLHPHRIERLIRYARYAAYQNGIRLGFLVTTNGLTLGNSAIQKLINRYKVSVSVSLDGPPEWHDEERKTLDGAGSYSRIAQALESFFRSYHSPIRSARATYRAIPGRMLGTYRHLKSMGFNDIAMGSSDFDHVLLHPEVKKSLFSEIDELVDEVKEDMLSGRVYRHSLLTEIFINLFVGNAKQVICGATRNHVAFDVYGGMQACHRYLGNTSYELTPNDIKNRKDSSLIREITKPGKTAHCNECWARSLCGGECFHVGKELDRHVMRRQLQEQLCSFKRKIFDSGVRAYLDVMERAPEKMHSLVYG